MTFEKKPHRTRPLICRCRATVARSMILISLGARGRETRKLILVLAEPSKLNLNRFEILSNIHNY